jgi:FAD binding domain
MLTSAAPADAVTIDVDALRATFAGALHLPGDAGYDDARAAWNLTVDQHPPLVAEPRDADDIAALVRFANAHGLRVAPQGTGHNASARAGADESILLNTRNLRAVEIDAANLSARVEAGALCADLTAPASELGLAALAGSSPDVGLVGYVLGGGVGWLGRAYGLCCNSVLSFDVVTGDGEQLHVDADNHPELFWALRGGSGSPAVITHMELKLYAVPELYAGAMLWPWERAREVFQTWLTWTRDAPETVTTSIRILQVPPVPEVPEIVRGRNFVVVDGAVIGGAEYACEVLAPFRALEPEIDMFAPAPPVALSHLHMDPETPVPGMSDHALLADLTPEVVDALVDATGPESESCLLLTELRHFGGALGRVPENAGARGRMEGKYIFFALGSPMTPQLAQMIPASLERAKAAIEPAANGRIYLNFAEGPSDVSTAFSEESFSALQAVKAKYDPRDTIHANHAVAPAQS